MRGSGCFIFERVRFSRRTVVLVRAPRGCSLLTFRQPARRHWQMWLRETTAIDIYLISPRPSTVSTWSRLASRHPLKVSFFFSSPGRWCQGSPPHPPTHTHRPNLSLAASKAPPTDAPGQRREREKVRGGRRGEEVKLKAPSDVKKHTRLCVFTCLLDEVSFSLHGRRRKKAHVSFLNSTFLSLIRIKCLKCEINFVLTSEIWVDLRPFSEFAEDLALC